MATQRDDQPAVKRRPGQRTGKTRDYPTDEEIERRRARVARMLLGHASRTRIAEILNVSPRTVDRDIAAIKELHRTRAAEDVAGLVGRELDLLDEIERRLWGDDLAVVAVEPRAMKMLLAIHDRRVRLLGLEGPKRVEITGSGGAPLIPGAEQEDLLAEVERLTERLAQIPERGPSPAPPA